MTSNRDCATAAERRRLLLGTAALGALSLLGGCASPSLRPSETPEEVPGLAEGAVPLVPAIIESEKPGQSEPVLQAFALVGTPYRWGGNTPEGGFDCSGLVRWVVRQSLGLDLPRSTMEIAQVGAVVRLEERLPGDLIFFNTRRHRFSHMGIYVGKNEFVHAPSRGGKVRLDRIDDKYWRVRITGVRRLA